MAEYLAKGRDSEIDHIPATEFCAPKSIDFTHGHHICIDGLYYAYLLVPSDGYKTQVPAGWLSLIVNAGDGIDMDMFLSRQPKETIIQKVGQQLRINRSKIKDASDTNTDFDDIDGAIRSGYFLKEGLANNEDFYYLNLLITITASNEEELEWKVSEMKKLLLSQDMNACTCHFREEQAFLSALPLVAMEKKLYERGKRNLLTGGAASCYPFTSYEMCDDNGILLGVNKYNSSLIIVDIFNSAVYKNANMSILGTSGAGKTFTMQLMALRMRRKIFNLVSPENSDSWCCLAEVEGQELMAQLFVDVIIKNTTNNGKSDHFWDACEMNLLKALVLYVDQGYAEENRNIGEVYRLLTLNGESQLDTLFEALPSTHPAKAPYSLFKQASDTVRSGVIIGLGSRLQVFQSELIKKITAKNEIDLELPGQQPCAYFLVTSDQDSTFDFLASLFLSFCFIKLVRYADHNCEGGKLPVPVHILGEELTACGTIPDLSRRLSVIRSRNISMSCVFQNLAGLQNRYPQNLWQEIIGNCDAQLF